MAGLRLWGDGESAVITMQFTRQDVADVLRKAGMPDAAEAALRELPEVFEDDQAGEWCLRHGLTSDQLMSMMGGSP